MRSAQVTFEDLAAAQQRLQLALDSYRRWQAETNAAARNLIDLLGRFTPIGSEDAKQLTDLTNQVRETRAELSQAVGENADPKGPAAGDGR